MGQVATLTEQGKEVGVECAFQGFWKKEGRVGGRVEGREEGWTSVGQGGGMCGGCRSGGLPSIEVGRVGWRDGGGMDSREEGC